jgi:hypothetical protein
MKPDPEYTLLVDQMRANVKQGVEAIIWPQSTPAPTVYLSPSAPGVPKDAEARKRCPIATGVLDYFPDAIAEIAKVSFIGNEQHNPGMPLHWDRTKSKDEADALIRHFLERGTFDSHDGTRHSAKMAWRALALLQKELERENDLTKSPTVAVKR